MPIMDAGKPEAWAEFTVDYSQGRITMQHKDCAWYYTFSVRGPGRAPLITLYEMMTVGAIHLHEHQPDGVWCVNAICSIHHGGHTDIHAESPRMSTDFPGRPFGRGDTVTIDPDA